MWHARLNKILTAPFELLRLQPDSDSLFSGRYLRLQNQLTGLGHLISQGAEAIVYELIDLETGTLAGVAKICRYPPSSAEYRTWAVPYRMQRNPASTRADVEMRPAVLHEVPGGLIKLQTYVSEDPAVDWRTTYPARPIVELAKEKGPEAALQCAEQLIALHGSRGILLELKGDILLGLKRWEEARDALTAAFHAHERESLTGAMRTGMALATAHKEIYRKDPYAGASAIATLKVPDGPTVNQVYFADPQASALSDTLEDRSLYILFEILNQEPCFIPALLSLADELSQSQISGSVALEVLDRIERIDPDRDDVKESRSALSTSQQRFIEHLASVAQPSESAAEGSDTANPEQAQPNPTVPPHAPSEAPAIPKSHASFKQAFEDAYQPELVGAQLALGRYNSALANLAAGRLKEAERAARAAMELDSDVVRYSLTLADVLKAAGQNQESLQLLQQTVVRFPDSPEAFLELGEELLKAGDPENARVAYLRAARLDPSSAWRADLGVGLAYRSLNQRAKALVHLRRAYSEAPDSRESILGTARTPWKAFAAMQLAYALRNEREGATDAGTTEALEIVNDALARFPEAGQLIVCRAQLLAQLGRINEAIEDLERAVRLDPKHEFAAPFLQGLRDHRDNQLKGETAT
jgi:tetratricopeptide (TPR) repeat protein